MSSKELDSAREEDNSNIPPPEEEYKEKGPALVRVGQAEHKLEESSMMGRSTCRKCWYLSEQKGKVDLCSSS